MGRLVTSTGLDTCLSGTGVAAHKTPRPEKRVKERIREKRMNGLTFGFIAPPIKIFSLQIPFPLSGRSLLGKGWLRVTPSNLKNLVYSDYLCEENKTVFCNTMGI
jgi:hypothetical protein